MPAATDTVTFGLPEAEELRGLIREVCRREIEKMLAREAPRRRFDDYFYAATEDDFDLMIEQFTALAPDVGAVLVADIIDRKIGRSTGRAVPAKSGGSGGS